MRLVIYLFVICCIEQERAALTAAGGPRAIMSAGDRGIHMNKRPSWRKTKQEIVDEKVERLFESYKLMEELERKQQAINGAKEAEEKKRQKNKYFPDDDDEERIED